MSPRNIERDQRQRELKREFIMDAALKTIGRKGIDSTNMKDIAIASKLSVGNLYTYFASKEILFAELLQRGQQRYGALVSSVAAAPDMDARAKLYYICDVWLKLEYNWAFTIMLQSIRLQDGVSEELKQVATERFTKNLEPMADIMRQGQAAGSIHTGDAYQMAFYFVSLIQGLTLQLAPNHKVPVNIEPRNIVNLFMTPLQEEKQDVFFKNIHLEKIHHKKLFDNL